MQVPTPPMELRTARPEVDPSATLAFLRTRAQQAEQQLNPGLANAIRDYAARLEGSPRTVRAMHQVRQGLDQAGFDGDMAVRLPPDVARGARGALSESIGETAEQADVMAQMSDPRSTQRLAEEWRGANEAYRTHTQVGEAAARRLGREEAPVLQGHQGMMGGAMSGGPFRAARMAGGLMGSRVMASRLPTAWASSLEGIARRLNTNPGSLGRFEAPLRSAMRRGMTQLAAAHFALSGREPEYRSLTTEEQRP